MKSVKAKAGRCIQSDYGMFAGMIFCLFSLGAKNRWVLIGQIR